MAHNAACTCVECRSRQAPAGQMRPADVITEPDVAMLLAEPVLDVKGPVMDPPAGVEASMVLGWIELDMPNPGKRVAAVVVACDDGRSRAIWYDYELGVMRAGVLTLLA